MLGCLPIMTKRDQIHPYGQRFGAIIRRLRIQRGMQVQQLARRADLTRQHLSLLERGANIPSLVTLFNLAEILRVKPSAIVAEIEADWYPEGERASGPQ